MDLNYLSRSRSFLWKLSLTILAVGVAFAWLFSGSTTLPTDNLSDSDKLLLRLSDRRIDRYNSSFLARYFAFLQSERVGPWECLDLVESVGGIVPDRDRETFYSGVDTLFGTEVSSLARDYWDVLSDESLDARNRLIDKSTASPPIRFSNRLLSKLALARGLRKEAASFLEREGEFADAQDERKVALRLYRELEDTEALERLLLNPKYSEIVLDWDRMQVAVARGEWGDALKYQIKHKYVHMDRTIALLALCGGLVWGVILFRLNDDRTQVGRDLILCFSAFLLGMASTTPTVFLISIFETFLGIRENGDFLNDLRFFIFSVGLREEFCKLVLFLPLVPFLVKPGSELRALVVAGFVGLGFAVDENIGYFGRSYAMSGLGRFLTANFFHIGMTGLCGLSLVRSISIRNYSFMDFIYVFGLVVLVHGMYDALISLPAFGDSSFLGFTVFVLISYRFFAETHSLRGTSDSAVSITATFTVGLSLFVALLLVYICSQIGFAPGLKSVAQSILGIGIVTFMFFREFREEMYD